MVDDQTMRVGKTPLPKTILLYGSSITYWLFKSLIQPKHIYTYCDYNAIQILATSGELSTVLINCTTPLIILWIL